MKILLTGKPGKEAEIILESGENITPDQKLAKALEKNSFLSCDSIAEHYREDLK